MQSGNYATDDNFISGFASVMGFANVGKSTLVNRLVGDKVSIVTSKPQTTRTRVRGIINTNDMQLVFLDTPGFHFPQDRLGKQMVKKARQSTRDVDVIIFCVDGSRAEPGRGDKNCAELAAAADNPVVLAVNKIDKIAESVRSGRIDSYSQLADFDHVMGISALTGENIDELLKALKQLLPRGGPRYFPPDMKTDRPLTFLIGELVREKVMVLTSQEIPYSTAVDVRSLEQRQEDTYYIGCDILVERNSQKGILIGKGGKMIKEIGQRSRNDVEDLLGVSVYLDLHVKVKKDWRDDALALRDLDLDIER